MGQQGRAGWPGTARAGAVAAAVALLAGCGSSQLPAGGGAPAGQHSTGVASIGQGRATGPAGGTRAQALALARKLLPQVILPPGSKVLTGTMPPRLRGQGVGLGSRLSVDVHRQFALPLAQSAASAFARGHVPAGIYLAEVDLTLVPAAGSGSLLRADAQVIWSPPRTAAEHIDPSRFASVVLTADAALARDRSVTKRIISRGVITRLAGLLNAMPADPGLAMPCPMGRYTYRVGFAATAHGRPSVVAATGACATVTLSAGGHQQPPLADQGNQLAPYVQHLLGIRQ